MTVFRGPEPAVLPTTDILSWIFDKPGPDADINNPILIDAANPTRSINFIQSKHLIQQYIAGLRHHGVQSGDCVLLHAPNDILYPILALAIIGCGAIFSGSNPSYTTHELIHHITVTSATYLLPDPSTLNVALAAAKATNLPTKNIILFTPEATSNTPPHPSGFPTTTSLLTDGTAPWVRFPQFPSSASTTSDPHHQSRSTPACRYTSSGTSGLPKATSNTHLNLIAQHENNFSAPYHHRPFHPVTHLWALPFFHAAVSPKLLTTIFKWAGRETVYVMKKFDTAAFAGYVRRYQVTELLLVPPMIVALTQYVSATTGPGVEKGRGEMLRSVGAGFTGAAPITAETLKRFRALLARDTWFQQGWGMTETNCVACCWAYGEGEGWEGSVGMLSSGMEAKLVDAETGEEKGVGERGEMWVRGESVVPGYCGSGSEMANRECWDDEGFFRTGDVMMVDDGGRWWVVDRVKELIKVRGFQVAPPEVEGVLLGCPGVVDVAVIGVKDNKSGEGEVCRAYVVRGEGWEGRLKEADVYDWVKERLVRYKRLDGGVVFVQSIPKTPSGKILKRLLREQVAREAKTAKI